MVLTEEQRLRMEENKRKALEKRRIEENKRKALEKRQQRENQNTANNRVVVNQSKSLPSLNLVKSNPPKFGQKSVQSGGGQNSSASSFYGEKPKIVGKSVLISKDRFMIDINYHEGVIAIFKVISRNKNFSELKKNLYNFRHKKPVNTMARLETGLFTSMNITNCFKCCGLYKSRTTFSWNPYQNG
jgi:hypothetical protein